jgi:hypothetical protein
VGRLNILDYLGKERDLYLLLSGAGMKDLVKLSSDAFAKYPTRTGVLTLLSVLGAGGGCPLVPAHLLDIGRYTEPEDREAAVVVRLAQEDLDRDEARTLAGHVIDLSGDRPGIYHLVLRTLERHKMTGPVVEAFISELWHSLEATEPIADWETTQRMLKILDESLRHRTSGVVEAWTELELPEELRHLVRV